MSMKKKYKQPKNKERIFEMNGGYFIKGVPYMDCKITGDPVRNVSVEAKSVIGSRAFMAKMAKMFPETEKPTYKPTGRPAGWHFMNEFVDKDGNVFHKGKEVPELKGTLPSTKVKPKKKIKRRSKEQILIDRHKKKKAVLKKAKKMTAKVINERTKTAN